MNDRFKRPDEDVRAGHSSARTSSEGQQLTGLALSVRSLSKSFRNTRALDRVTFSVEAGEVRALLGGNGSGKSTLIKIMSGYHQPDEGRIYVAGDELRFGTPAASFKLGCRFVHQDLGLVKGMSILDNLAFGNGYRTRFGSIPTKATYAQAREDMERFDLDLDPKHIIDGLSAADQTGVAIVRALRGNINQTVRLLTLDEPTARLPKHESDRLFQLVKRVAASGVAVIYVTHRLGEVFEIADTATVLRDGELISTGIVAELSRTQLVEQMVGEDEAKHPAGAPEPRALATDGRIKPRLVVSDLTNPDLRDLSFEARTGEVLGLAGVTGSGRDAALPAVFGATRGTTGSVRVDDVLVRPGRPDLAIAHGVAYLPGDRKTLGSVQTLSAMENFTLGNLREFWRGFWLRIASEKSHTNEWFTKLDVRPASAGPRELRELSGGNQQKVLFGKWLRLDPATLLLDEPTQGVDVTAKRALHAQIRAFVERGGAAVVSSSDLEELATVCDRVLIISHGRVVDELTDRNDITASTIARRVLNADR